MKKLVLMCGVLVGMVSVSMGVMSDEERQRASNNCFENSDKSACQALINNGLVSVEQCNKDSCWFVGGIYYLAGRYREAIPYFEKVIALGGDNRTYQSLGNVYLHLQDYYNAKKYYEIACDKGNGDIFQSATCHNLGVMYANGEGVRQDYAKAAKLYKKACDMKYGGACNDLGVQYDKGQGVRQNRSTAKQYYGKACDLGEQMGCDNYKKINQAGY